MRKIGPAMAALEEGRTRESRNGAATGSWKKQEIDSPLEPPEGRQPCLLLDFSPFGLLTPRTVR